MSKTNPEWSEDALCFSAQDIFLRAQEAWSNQDLALLSDLLHPSLFPNWESKIKHQISQGERNFIKDLSIVRMKVVDAKNYSDESRDSFSVFFDARADDQKVKNGHVLFTKKFFREYWTFQKYSGKWTLLSVAQDFEGWVRFMNEYPIGAPNNGKEKK